MSPDGTFVEKVNEAPDHSPFPMHTCAACCTTITEAGESTIGSIRHKRSLSKLREEHELYRPEVLRTIEQEIARLEPELHELSDDIWSHPEIAYEERYAHDRLVEFMSGRGFTITPHYLDLPTAWKAEYTRGKSGRTIGVCSEMDALPGIGHACGHNLIAASGVAIALALKAALDDHDISGTIVLLGTPAEETGGGKIQLVDRGAFKGMDACIMAHPAPGTPHGAWIAPWLSLQHLEVEFFGHSSHAGYSPWDAQNALDAAFLAYSSISVLRQQMKPTCRVHGIVTGRDWEPNVIPDYAKMRWIVRAPTWGEVVSLRTRVVNCFEAAALATACKVKIKFLDGYFDVRENSALAQDFCEVVESQYGVVTETMYEPMGASTDFGNVSYVTPSIQPAYTIPTKPKGNNHTPEFADSARQPEAFQAMLTISKGLAMTGLRVLADSEFYQRVKQSYEAQKAADPFQFESS